MATVVAHIVSEDVLLGKETSRLILRLECLTQPHRPARIVTVAAISLDELDDATLRALTSGVRGRRQVASSGRPARG